jgi:2-phospho-L-lactate guanylyltransferase
MPSLVVPFRGAEGKSRLELPTRAARAVLVRAMLADVVTACLAVGPTFVVTPDASAGSVLLDGARFVADPRRGQGEAVRAGLDAAFAAGAHEPLLVVNADLPCVTARDLLALAGAAPSAGLAIAAAADGTTNAIALASADLFVPVYGPGSASRFARLGPSRIVDVPNLVDDVDTVADLMRLGDRLGPHTRSVLATLHAEAAA